MRILKGSVTLLVVSLVALTAGTANAKDPTDPNAGAGVKGDEIGVAIVGVQHGRGPSRGGADSSGCHWTNNSSQIIDPAFFETTKIINGITYKPFLKECPNVLPVLIYVPQVTPQQIALTAAAYAAEKLLKPTTNAAPPLDKGIVKLGMWFWTDPNQYKPVTAFAWVPTANGSITATATANPTHLTFNPGEPDGAPISCQGPGTPWIPAYGDEAESPCMYTYQHSSEIDPKGTFTATLTTTWAISWIATTGQSGDLGQHTTTTTQQITVNEIQALITG
jgi:hypothetical protein